ncbi:MAG: 50S ribosomal protein L22 [Candidatus Hydrogenedentes bacterium]|jgi:large subunit ribosomal protein L22|nr:50S ribosomal protein L22 [Candidatus Hydrogenedentota bacterium]
MAAAIARAKWLRIAPRKMRLVVNLIRGKTVGEARSILLYTVKRGAPIVGKVLESAVANAESAAAERRERINTDDMIVTKVYVDEGPTLKKFQPQPRGRATRIRKRSSHVTLTIADKSAQVNK